MNKLITKIHINPLLTALLLLCIFSFPRLIIYINLKVGSSDLNNYYNALYLHFFDYILKVNLLPPLNYLLDAIPVFIFGPIYNSIFRGTLIFYYFLDFIAFILIYRIFKIFNIRLPIRVIIISIFSTSIIALELWWSSGHYDHFTVVLMAYFCYSLAIFYMSKDNSNIDLVNLSISTTLIQLQLPVATFIIPGVLLVMLWLADATKKYLYWKIFLIFIISVLISASLCIKNYLNSGILSPSSKGGPALMMQVQNIFNQEPEKIRNFLLKSRAPDWYLWCYDNAQSPPNTPPVFVNSWLFLSKAYGTCLPWTNNVEANEPFPFNFDELIGKLESYEFLKLKWVLMDKEDSIYSHYLYAGTSPELSPRWIGLYGQESMRIGLSLIYRHPIEFFNGFKNNFDNIFYNHGPLFLSFISDQRKTQGYLFSNMIHLLNQYIFSFILKFGYTISLLTIVIPLLKNKVYFKNYENKQFFDFLLIIGILSTGFTVMYCGFVGGENDRYFVHLLIPSLIIFTIVFNFLYSMVVDKFSLKAN